MKILNVINFIDPYKGGGSVERVCLLSHYLTKLGNEVTIVSTKKGNHKKQKKRFSNVNFVLFNYISDRYMIPINCISWIKKNINNYDIVHLSMNWTIINVIFYFLLKSVNKSYYFSAMGWLKIDGNNKLLKKLYFIFFTKKIAINAKKCIAVSQREFEEYLKLGVPKKNILLIPNGLDTSIDQSAISSNLFLKKFNLSKKKIILFLGRYDYIKGTDILIEAFAKFNNVNKNIYQLVLVGFNDEFKKKLLALSKKLFLSDEITFINPIIGDLKYSAYKSANIFIIPSRFDTMTIVALEAALFELPIIYTSQCNFPELAKANGGIEVNADNNSIYKALLSLSRNPKKIKKLGQNAKKFVVKNYSWEIISKIFLNEFIDK